MVSPPDTVRRSCHASVMRIGEKRDRMWIFILLYILGLNICQAAVEEYNSTQMHYLKLIVDVSVLNNSNLTSQFEYNNTNVILNVTGISTVCETVSAGTKCTCREGYKWSSDTCLSNKECCGQLNCTFTKVQMCVSDSSVKIQGSIHLPAQTYKGCLSEKGTEDYRGCHDLLLRTVKAKYSTLIGFESLTITRFSLGSVIADFTATIVSVVKSGDLINRSRDLCANLTASMQLETRGIVKLTPPNYIVKYDGEARFTCTTEEVLGVYPQWWLRQPDKTHSEITSGTQAGVSCKAQNDSTVTLTNVTELWAGEYLCCYHQKEGNTSITHIANATIDISLLPNIEAYTKPSFPRCKTEKDLLRVEVVCEIYKSTEQYNVSWDCEKCIKTLKTSNGKLFYTAEQLIGCGADTKPEVNCTFINRCGQNRKTKVPINIIKVVDKFCPADGEWEDTKATFTAQLKCPNMAGLRKRNCRSDGTWDIVESECVNAELRSVLQNAIIVDSGRGVFSDNVASVFSKLHNVTDNTENVNSYPNIRASVSVFKTLNEKLIGLFNTMDKSTTDDFLKSSDNLLEKSLEKAWRERTSNVSDDYLKAVEELIKIFNILNNEKKTNLEVGICNNTSDNCNTNVLNVTINFKSSGNTTLKTAGFKHIESYLTNNNTDYYPNSIVVSATTQEKMEGIEIKIQFPLHKPRPRNVKMMCVARNLTTGEWLEEGCEWGGSTNEELCICTHLSSFAILMSKSPIELNWTSEITFVGVSVSVASLILSLLIELIVWSSVVKTNTLYLRHTAHINISLSLLVADCCFLASSEPKDLSDIWCSTVVVVKHFCYLSMFFWMLCLSSTLLHQAIFLFHKVSKKYYLRFSLVLGYACPFLIVLVTFLTNGAGTKDQYYSRETCWLVYKGSFQGSIYTFLIPIGMIIFFNVFSMVVVIIKLLDHQNIEKSHDKEKTAAKTIVRTVILLTPIFGVTWMFGFGVMLIDLTDEIPAAVVNYAFIVLNSFQGFFIFLTTCLGDKMTRDALLNKFRKKAPVSTSDSTMKTDSTIKK